MINKDKFLKDGVSAEEFANEFESFCIALKEENIVMTYKQEMKEFLNCEIKPTLTEDERVILRNIQKGLFREGFISRTAGNELFVFIKETGETIELYIFNHLFQFIKERRSI